MSRLVRLVGVSLSVAVGAIAMAVLAGALYLESTSTTCNDVLRSGQLLQCAAPTAPWWLLVIGGVVGGGLSGAVTYRALGPDRLLQRRTQRIP